MVAGVAAGGDMMPAYFFSVFDLSLLFFHLPKPYSFYKTLNMAVKESKNSMVMGAHSISAL